MKISASQLKKLVEAVIAEAKKKKDDLEEEVRPDAHMYDKVHDYSAPLGAYNLYRSQGPVNWGPHTGPGPKIDDRPYGVKNESALRSVIRQLVSEALTPAAGSEWCGIMPPAPKPLPTGIWESAMHWYDFQGKGLGGPTSAASAANMVEKKLGFKHLKAKLAHKKGVKDAGALAASIGRKKYGAEGMAKKSAAGRK
jgi:hypothetical protein